MADDSVGSGRINDNNIGNKEDMADQNHVEETSPLLEVSGESNSTKSASELRSMSKQRHWKNLLGLSLAFMVTFTAYSSLQNLQSSLNYDAALGVASLGVIYACLMISCLIAPAIIRTLGTKWTVAFCLFCYTFYTAANFYPEYYTLIPTAAALGFAAGPVWAAQGTYLTTLAMSLADVSNELHETIINQFNGIFFCLYNTSQIWGNMISSIIFSMNATTEHLNETDLWKCGRNGTGKESMNFENPGEKKTDLLLSLYLGFGILGAIVAIVLLDKIRPNATSSPNTKLSSHLLEVVHLMHTPYVGLLIPLMMFCGFEQAYIFGDFTKSFVTCTIGVQSVGYVMIAFGVSDALSSICVGRLEAIIGRQIIFTAGALVNTAIIMWMLFWRASENVQEEYQLYLMAVGWGFGDAVWNTQISSILGVLLPQSQEAAFANFQFWQSAGFVLSVCISLSNNVFVYHKLYVQLGLLVISMILYYSLEWIIRLRAHAHSTAHS